MTTVDRDPIDELLIGLSLSDHLGDVVGEVRRFMKVTERPCPEHHPADYDTSVCWICGIEGSWDEENCVFTPLDNE